MGERFDRFVAIDWSAAARPVTGTNSVWIAVLDRATGGEPRLANPSTRRQAEIHLAELTADPVRTLVVVDASLGYPRGSADWFGLVGPSPWLAMWRHLARHVTDDETNGNNRFEVAAALNRRRAGEGPFWGRPRAVAHDGLAEHKPASFPVDEYRVSEARLRDAGRRPASVWQLTGAGSVGSQTITLLPVLHRLWSTGAIDVWPFTTGLTAPDRQRAVVAETWPTAFDLDLSIHPVRDAAQVAGVVHRFAAADDDGRLTAWFAPDVAPDDRETAESEEGWVLTPPIRTAPAG